MIWEQKNILIKGGHLESDAIDIFLMVKTIYIWKQREFKQKYIMVQVVHFLLL